MVYAEAWGAHGRWLESMVAQLDEPLADPAHLNVIATENASAFSGEWK